jgi:iron complex transport system ATP-binding protein
MNPACLLKYEHITFGYPTADQPVMKEFDLEIGAGTVTAILGPNGAGKTTLLHLTLGWLKPQSGIVLLDQRALGDFSRRALGQWMGLVPQSEHTPFEFSLLEFVLLGRAPHLPPLAMPGKEDGEIAADALQQVGLAKMQNRSILSLSGGERQLVLIARALVQQPRLLLLDEPTAHLDLGNKIRLLGLLRKLQGRQVTIVLTTHEPEVAAAIATHLVLMRNGQVLRAGPLAETCTSQWLSTTYGVPVQVTELGGRRVVLSM